jgi:hypothetical protein
LGAERTGGPSGGNHGACPLSERACLLGGEPDPKGVLALGIVISDIRYFTTCFVDCVGLDDHTMDALIPAEGHSPHAKLFNNRYVQGSGIGRSNTMLGNINVPTSSFPNLVEELIHTLGQRARLGFLEDHAGDPTVLTGLQEEGPLAGLTDRAHHEAVGAVELKDLTRHTPP